MQMMSVLGEKVEDLFSVRTRIPEFIITNLMYSLQRALYHSVVKKEWEFECVCKTPYRVRANGVFSIEAYRHVYINLTTRDVFEQR